MKTKKTKVYQLCKEGQFKLHAPLDNYLLPKTSVDVFNKLDQYLYMKSYDVLKIQVRNNIKEQLET